VARLLFLVVWSASTPALAQPSYTNFEVVPVRPLAMAGTTVFAVNTPDDRLEIFDAASGALTHRASVPVGLAPVAVAIESPSRVWVVNHLSDSASIVDVASDPPRVVRTLLVGDEPSDVVFAQGRAFVSTAHRGQNHPAPRGDFEIPGVGRADVFVFDPSSLGSALGGTPLEIVSLFGDKPRALAVSADGSRVYAAVFHSGNRTTTLNEGLVCDGGPSAGECRLGGATVPGGLPPPTDNYAGIEGPEVGLIVRYDGERWVDELGRDFSGVVRFELPDLDVFTIDAAADPPREIESVAGVGTVLFSMIANPATGALYVANTEAMNHVRFEGPGTHVRAEGHREGQPATVRGHLHEARITVIDGGEVTPVRLNQHIAYDDPRVAPGTRARSVATPLGMAISSDGETLYVAGYGSSAVAVLDTADLEAGSAGGDGRLVALGDPGPVGPAGLWLDEPRGRLYVATRFDNSIATVDVATRTVIARTRLHTPERESTIVGRPMLYDARFTSSNGEASCSSCHVFGDLDSLAWDLGNPDADVLPNPNPEGPLGTSNPFHPLKGPMTTQSFRGMAFHGPMHWRGDRTAGHAMPAGDPLDERGAFEEFNVAFEGLLGREEGPLRADEMRRFAEFVLGIEYPPNPIRRLDNSLRADEERGRAIYFDRGGIDAISTCNGCHTVDRAQGFFGGDGRTTFENETQEFKIPHLRNAYQKVGMFGMPAASFVQPGDNGERGPQIRGFGFLHDGSIDTAFRFLRASVFLFPNDDERRDVEAFIMAFDSLLPPIVGQQVTLEGARDAAVDARIDLLIARAQASLVWPAAEPTTECDLVAHGVEAGRMRGWLREPSGLFRTDRASEAPVELSALRALASTSSPFTFTCVPPGAGERSAIDRDEDGMLDGDDLEPASRPFIAIPNPPIPGETMPGTDGGASSDGGTRSDAGSFDAGAIDSGATEPTSESSGCGCRAGGASSVLAWAIVVAALLGRRRARRA
jgi:DNA-binding beta-propeller fold protein YncE